MPGSLKIATVRGIPLHLHFTLLATVLLLVVQLGWMGIPAGILLFGSVFLHELGHAVVAQRYGIEIASINLHVVGGVALMKEPPRTARQEMWIAAAGPAVSFGLGAILLALALVVGVPPNLVEPRPIDLIAWGAMINLAMAIFNLVPALPMDGGRMFRAALSTKLGALRATHVAAWISRGFAVVFIVVALIYQAWGLGLVGVFLLLLVANEVRIARIQDQLRREREAYRLPWVARTGAFAGHDAAASGSVTREEFVDPYGRRYVVITRLS